VKDPSCVAVVESWATGVEWMFAQERYKNKFSKADYNYDNGEQFKRISPYQSDEEDLHYTSLVIDLMDSYNQRLERGSLGYRYPQDAVSGYTITQIETALKGSESWNQWRNRMIELYPQQASSIHVSDLFANWY
jgi:hypothetical protein